MDAGAAGARFARIAFILALTLAASASRSLAASLAAMVVIVRGLCWGAISRGLGNLLSDPFFSLGVAAVLGIDAGREIFFGDAERSRDRGAGLGVSLEVGFEVLRNDTSSSPGVETERLLADFWVLLSDVLS